MSGALERYQKLSLRESLSRVYDYPSACNELSFILRGAYAKVPKNLQSIIFDDTLIAFRLFPKVHTQSGKSAANLLLQAAEAALPKQKKVLAVTEFKHAVVAHKRRCKAQKDEEGSLVQLPQDVLVHIFSYLDMQSLVAVGLVCWSWSLAANDNQLWLAQYVTFFESSESNKQIGKPTVEWSIDLHQKKESMNVKTVVDWREAFKMAYLDKFSSRLRSNRGYCGHCKSIVWLSNMKCTNFCHASKPEKIKPISSLQGRSALTGLGFVLTELKIGHRQSGLPNLSLAQSKYTEFWKAGS
ncbi:F-box domain [Macleaya cordata]|uniref:F-box domain n=1 Tax=Macleaya cordata TaxID=56857 RepID=A0A200R891_MACCD|nr:F-box domain [Macleaya cordata]